MNKLQVSAVSAVETREYANKPHEGGTARSFKKVTFMQPLQYVDAESGEILTRMSTKQQVLTVFNISFLDNKVNPLYEALIPGAKVEGDIVTVPTEPFSIPQRKNGQLTGNMITIDKDTFLVFGNSDDQEAWAELVEKTRKQRADQRAKQAISAASVAGVEV